MQHPVLCCSNDAAHYFEHNVSIMKHGGKSQNDLGFTW